MTQVTEAIYRHGVLEPLQPLALVDEQRVRLIVEPLNGPRTGERAAVIQRLREGIRTMGFRSSVPYPTRDELHDRV